MRIFVLIAVLFVASSFARADEFKHWVEPPAAPISPTGTILSVENYRCIVTSARSFECLNVGRVCVEQRKRDDEKTAKTFGCAIEGEPTYPCPKYDPPSDVELRQEMACAPTAYGW